jgi:hypothetical protein
MLAFQEALTQAIELWDKTPVSILDQQAVQTHALLLAMGKYITYRKEKGELESCPDGSDFINRLIKVGPIAGQEDQTGQQVISAKSGAGSQHRGDQWGFHPTVRVASINQNSPLIDLGAGHSDNCSSIAVYQLVL